jgi:hypothetical protein
MERGKEGKVKTVLRVRPLTQEEGREDARGKHATLKLLPGGKKIVLAKEGTAEREFEFEAVVGGRSTSQESFYSQHCAAAVNNLFAGYNTTLLVYGHVAILYTRIV